MTINEIAERRGPFAVVYMDASHDTEDAAQQLELRRRSIHARLHEAGASEQMLALFDRAIAEGPPGRGRAGRVLIIDDTAVHVDELLPEPPGQEVVRVSPLPYLLPILRHHEAVIPHVVAVVDRTGCDLKAVDEHGEITERVIDEDPYPVHKPRGGAWSHRSIQQRVEDTTRHTIDELAGEVAAEADHVHAEVIVVAGEVAARSALHRSLPEHGADVVEVEAGARAPGSDPGELADAVHDVVAARSRHDRAAVLDTLTAEIARPDGLAVAGLSATAEALRTARVDRLLIDPDRLGDRTVLVGDDRAQVSVDLDAPVGWTGDTADHRTCRADEALPVAALLTGAEVTVTSGLPSEDGVAALVRYR
ncbi:Vms1/Ankzf1 family peptidyl-tRNA hydrolase [Nocardia halotolerans]|uniref:Vms1/Ankzf1 family peptidyl-tRNA hydrolase n=1 Tax=Nocardia halotolerans TaxID=1755878 RepID=A0ABV8VAQ3_9NOCA